MRQLQSLGLGNVASGDHLPERSRFAASRCVPDAALRGRGHNGGSRGARPHACPVQHTPQMFIQRFPRPPGVDHLPVLLVRLRLRFERMVGQRLVHQFGETGEQDRPGGLDADAARLRVKICLIDVETEIVHRRPRAINKSLKSDPSSRGVSTRTHRRAASQRAFVFAAAF